MSLGSPRADWVRPWESLFLPSTALSCILVVFDPPMAALIIEKLNSVGPGPADVPGSGCKRYVKRITVYC